MRFSSFQVTKPEMVAGLWLVCAIVKAFLLSTFNLGNSFHSVGYLRTVNLKGKVVWGMQTLGASEGTV